MLALQNGLLANGRVADKTLQQSYTCRVASRSLAVAHLNYPFLYMRSNDVRMILLQIVQARG